MNKTKANNYTVLKNMDIKEHLTDVELHIFNILLNKIVGNSVNRTYYVCNSDEPYAKDVLKAILDGEDSKREDYHTTIENYLKSRLYGGYNKSLEPGMGKHTHLFSLESYPLKGDLKTELNKLVDSLQTEISSICDTFDTDNISWNIVDLERFRDYDNFIDLYTGSLIIDTNN